MIIQIEGSNKTIIEKLIFSENSISGFYKNFFFIFYLKNSFSSYFDFKNYGAGNP